MMQAKFLTATLVIASVIITFAIYLGLPDLDISPVPTKSNTQSSRDASAAEENKSIWRIKVSAASASDKPDYVPDKESVPIDMLELASHEWTQGDVINFLVPQENHLVIATITDVEKHPGGIVTVKSYPTDDSYDHVLFTFGEKSAFGNIFTSKGEYEVVGDKKTGWIFPSSSLPSIESDDVRAKPNTSPQAISRQLDEPTI